MARILVIDDEESARYTLREYLQTGGHEVVVAEDGGKGLDLHNDNGFNLVIVDIYMPGLGGLETIQMLRLRDQKLPIIAVSGGGQYKRLESLISSVDVGATTRMLKPFTKDHLLEVVQAEL